MKCHLNNENSKRQAAAVVKVGVVFFSLCKVLITAAYLFIFIALLSLSDFFMKEKKEREKVVDWKYVGRKEGV